MFLSGSGILATTELSYCIKPYSLILPCWMCVSLVLVLRNDRDFSETSSEKANYYFVSMETQGEETPKKPLSDVKLETTLALIKPDAFDRYIEVEDAILRAGFVVLQKRVLKLSPEKASEFYEEHMDRPFFPDLVAFMSRGPIIALVLSKKDAVREWRHLIGPTNSEKAREIRPDSLRAIFGTDGQQNAFHGSDSETSAIREIKFFFPNVILEARPLQDIEEYLEGSVGPTLIKGLAALCHNKPLNPAVWLADWLTANNPNKPQVEEAQ